MTTSTTGAKLGRIGGRQLTVVDVTDPRAPKIAGQTPTSGDGAATSSTHTVACMDAACSIAYTAGDEDGFSIIDLTDLAKPREIGTVKSPAAQPNPVFSSGAGHHWNVDGAGIAWHTGSGGTAAFDISDPRHPLALTGTDENGTKSPYNDFIHHNSQRPNARAFAPGKPLSVTNGNVVLITEEDYANDGDEVACDKAGTFQTWQLSDLDGAAYRARNPDAEADKGTMHVLDTINPPAESGGGLTTPVGGFCSAHWFDYHQSGIVAQGYYQQGLRLIDVRDPRNLKQFGYYTGGGTEVWDAYWAPERDSTGSVIPGRKSNVVYTVDAANGVQVFSVDDLPADLPTQGDSGDRGTFPAAAPAPAPAADGTGGQATTTPIAGSQSCGAPSSSVARTSTLRRSGTRLRGTARGAGCDVAAVQVAVGRKVGSGCRWLREDGSFGTARSCHRTQYVRAAGTTRWTLRRALRLPRGSYLVWSRALDVSGRIERKAAARNLLRTTVRVRS